MIRIEWLLAIVYLFGGLNDLFMDLVFWCGPLRRRLAQGRENPTAKPEELELPAEKPIAILIPAWDESAVIGSMLESTCARLDYNNYDIFVGTYPNDEATQMEVARAAFDRPWIHRVVCPNDGPTSKADCLNWIVEAIKLKERENGKRYEIFTLQDAEDVVHPLTLKVFNRFIPEYDLVQIPVIPYERYLHKLTGGTYLDEFAEVHLKNLDARLAVGGMVPSAGVGTGFGRDACDELAAQTNHVLFPPVSLTEDYDFSFRLYRNGRKSGLAKVWTVNEDNPDNVYDELVAIREFFPSVFSDAVRQKQRWMLGITFQGWEKLGWGRGWRERYMLVRDRIGPLASLLNLFTAFLVFRMAVAIADALLKHHGWNAELGQFHFTPALDRLIDVNLLMLLNRIYQRALCVKQVARRRQTLMVPFRLVWANVIDFYCTVHAVRRYLHARVTGKPLKWLKTMHEFPNVESLLRTHRPLGDLLLERRLITPAQLREALATQRWTGEKRLLGQILVGSTAITQDQLEATLSLQGRSKVLAQEAVDAELQAEPLRANTEPLLASSEPAMVETNAAPPVLEEPALSPVAAVPIVLAQPEPATPIAVVAKPVVKPRPVQPYAEPEPVKIVRIKTPKTPMRAANIFEFTPAPAPQPDLHTLLAKAAAHAVSGLRPAATPGMTPVGPPPPKLALVPPKAKRTSRIQPHQLNRKRFSMLHEVTSQWKTPFPSKRILIAVGTRPEAIKLAPLIRELHLRVGTLDGPERVFVCATGQHEDMVEEALAIFGVRVDLNLGLMTPEQSLTAVSARILSEFEAVLENFAPDWVIVQGDTATTAMAGLAAFYAGVRVAHVEAGLRTNDLRHPFPEEFNRRMVGLYASIHFAATDWAKTNLLREGVDKRDIVVTGNTGIDALRSNCDRLGLRLDRVQPRHSGPVRVLVTAHRRENLEEGIGTICAAIANLVAQAPGKYVFLWPMHPNPRVHKVVKSRLAHLHDVVLTGPASYDELLAYLDQCSMVLTDSGGLQEEAPSFGKPVLILRDRTERPEGVQAGMAWLVGTDRVRIEAALEAIAQQIIEHRTLTPGFNPYGDGHASARIADYFAGHPVDEFTALDRDEEPRTRQERQTAVPQRRESDRLTASGVR